MKPVLAVSFLAAASLHALLLFGVHISTTAQPLAMSDEPSSVDVNLVEAPPAVPSATPAPTPEPPQPQPEPTPMMPQVQVEAQPTPGPEPVQPIVVSTSPAPQPVREKPAPRPPADLGRPKRMVLPSAVNANAPISTRASYRSNPKPDYPAEARRQHQEGVVYVSVDVGTDGRPASVSLKSSSGFPLLDQAALQAVRRWIFEPARSGPLAVASRVDVPVRFSLMH